MKKYKVINKSDLSDGEVEAIANIISNIIKKIKTKPFKKYKTAIKFNREFYYIDIKCGIIRNTIIIKQKIKK